MTNKKPTKPLTDLELDLMKVVWDLGPCTVREVHEHLLDQRPLAYTTVLTVMGILEQKGHLRKEKDGRAHRYTPTRGRRQVLGEMVTEFVGRVFDGSARPLLLSLLEGENVSGEDLAAVRRLLEAKDEEKP